MRKSERESEKEGERELLFLFLKGMTGALAPLSYLVLIMTSIITTLIIIILLIKLNMGDITYKGITYN